MVAKRKRKVRPPLPAPQWSKRVYVRLEPKYVGMFRFLLEAEDNLGYMSIVDKFTAIGKVVFSPHQEREMRRFLAGMQETIPFEIFEAPTCTDETL